MLEKQVRVRLKTGLQARPAALFVQEANRFSSEIFLGEGWKKSQCKKHNGINEPCCQFRF